VRPDVEKIFRYREQALAKTFSHVEKNPHP